LSDVGSAFSVDSVLFYFGLSSTLVLAPPCKALLDFEFAGVTAGSFAPGFPLAPVAGGCLSLSVLWSTAGGFP